jgi:hypothetical protein
MPELCPVDQILSAPTPVKLASEDQKLSSFLSNRLNALDRLAGETSTADQPTLQRGVREPSPIVGGGALSTNLASPPAHPSNRLIAQLNENWRVVEDPLQWILQRKKGNPRKNNSGWADRSFCRTRAGLLRCIPSCGEVDVSALTKLQSLPDYHVDWEQSR